MSSEFLFQFDQEPSSIHSISEDQPSRNLPEGDLRLDSLEDIRKAVDRKTIDTRKIFIKNKYREYTAHPQESEKEQTSSETPAPELHSPTKIFSLKSGAQRTQSNNPQTPTQSHQLEEQQNSNYENSEPSQILMDPEPPISFQEDAKDLDQSLQSHHPKNIFEPVKEEKAREPEQPEEQEEEEEGCEFECLEPPGHYLSVHIPRKKSLGRVETHFFIERVLFLPPKFHMHINGEHILTARKKIIQTNSKYFFFSDPEDLSTQGTHYVGYMEAKDPEGTQFNVYSYAGTNLARILFDNSGGKNQPIQITVILPKDDLDESVAESELGNENKTNKKSAEIRQLEETSPEQIIVVSSRKPEYNPVTKRYVMSFRGRATVASQKNMILEDQFKREVLLLGRFQQKNYNLDFSYPFSQLVAFAVAISNYEQKLGKKQG